jgi:hypothetical protein
MNLNVGVPKLCCQPFHFVRGFARNKQEEKTTQQHCQHQFKFGQQNAAPYFLLTAEPKGNAFSYLDKPGQSIVLQGLSN